eukprot:TRINITY_DN10649_c0_g1_i1.p1 TRINITY_DN10649_c0_g1~~TRINITY_DN10649_c0_g1_i1.p1  ORF type:complete len:205 (-),score=38.55 TRINITY_DN10649_c0_g1_i1:117-731(-)
MEALNHLLQAPSKKTVQEIFIYCFKNRRKQLSVKHTSDIVQFLQQKINEQQAEELIDTVKLVVSETLYYSMTESQLEKFLGDSVDTKLKGLIIKIIVNCIPSWREESIRSQVSLPRLRNIDWRIDIKSASDQIIRMSVPTVIVQLQVDETLKNVSQQNLESNNEDSQLSSTSSPSRNIHFELSKDALEIMLEGLEQIRKQLDNI